MLARSHRRSGIIASFFIGESARSRKEFAL
jgi:hypothetical protein